MNTTDPLQHADPDSLRTDDTFYSTTPPNRTDNADLSGNNSSSYYHEAFLPSCDGIPRINDKDITVQKKLGNGAFGSVVRARWRTKTVAIKYLYNSSDADKELKNLQKVAACDRVVVLHGITRNMYEDIGIVMEYCPNGSLRDYMSASFERLNWKDKFTLAEDIALGLDSVHSKGLLHRDLHPGNILINDQGRALLSDFGLSREEISTTSGKTTFGKYVPPERMVKDPLRFTHKGDIYSLGLIFWEISSGRAPFPSSDKHTAAMEVLEGKRENPISNTPRIYQDLYMRCWADDPEDRPDLRGVIKTLRDLSPPEYTGGYSCFASLHIPSLYWFSLQMYRNEHSCS
jgi:serine/threonine protein kinase